MEPSFKVYKRAEERLVFSDRRCQGFDTLDKGALVRDWERVIRGEGGGQGICAVCFGLWGFSGCCCFSLLLCRRHLVPKQCFFCFILLLIKFFFFPHSGGGGGDAILSLTQSTITFESKENQNKQD